MDTVLFYIFFISGQYTVTATTSRIRLVNGHGAPNQGRLEVYDNLLGVWGTVCDDLFDRNAAGVVCRQLGYSRLTAQVRSQAFFGPGRGRIAYDDVRCSGSETDLSQCSHAMITDCTHSEDVGVICQSTTIDADCNFEQSGHPCQWANINGENFVWLIINGSTPSLGTGPGADHTLGTSSGHYAFIETSSPRKPGDIACLVSPSLSQSNTRCLQFWYHMWGRTMGTLNVVVSTTSGNSTVWSLKGDQGNAWHLARVPVTSTKTYQVYLEAIVGSSYFSDIAVDDISFSNFSCSVNPSAAIPSQHVPLTTGSPPLNCKSVTCQGYNNTCILSDKGRNGTLTAGCQHECQHNMTFQYSPCGSWPLSSCCCRTQSCINSIQATTPLSTTTSATTVPTTTQTPCQDNGPVGYCLNEKEIICKPTDERGLKYAQLMCPVTCNLCSEHLRQDCEDNDKNGLCQAYKATICNAAEPKGKEFAINACAKTCNLCHEYYAIYNEKPNFTIKTTPTTTMHTIVFTLTTTPTTTTRSKHLQAKQQRKQQPSPQQYLRLQQKRRQH